MCLSGFLSWVIELFLELGGVMGIDIQPYMLVKQELNRKIVEKFFDREAGLFRNSDRPEAAGFSVLANAWGVSWRRCGRTGRRGNAGSDQEEWLRRPEA